MFIEARGAQRLPQQIQSFVTVLGKNLSRNRDRIVLRAEAEIGGEGEINTLADWRRENGFWDARRAMQARRWFEEEVRLGLLARLTNSPEMRRRLDGFGVRVAAGDLAPTAAAKEMLGLLGAAPDLPVSVV